METPVDVESQQGTVTPKAQRGSWQNCFGEVDLNKWYEWSAYYIPILEWLPQYKRTILTNQNDLSQYTTSFGTYLLD